VGKGSETVDEANELLRESVRAIKSSRGQPMLITAGAVMTEAKRLARNAVKAQWQAQGRKVPHIPYIELVEAARDYLDTHRAELIQQARANLSSDAQCRKP
jgi:hypothetical protein